MLGRSGTLPTHIYTYKYNNHNDNDHNHNNILAQGRNIQTDHNNHNDNDDITKPRFYEFRLL